MLDQAGGDVAALIAEPIQGVGGFTHGPDGLLGAFAKELGEHGILWISDEVQTGWGRTGEHFWGWQAHAQGGTTPDIVTFAKGIGNGLSVGGVIARAEIMDSLRGNSISTFGGSPITAAGALANLRYLLAHDLQGNAAKVGPILLDGLRELDSPIVGDVRGKGLMIGVELVRPAVHMAALRAGAPRRARARAGERRAGGDEAARPAGRQGRPVRQRAAHRAPADAHPRGGDGGAGPAHGVDRGGGGGAPRRPRPCEEKVVSP